MTDTRSEHNALAGQGDASVNSLSHDEAGTVAALLEAERPKARFHETTVGILMLGIVPFLAAAGLWEIFSIFRPAALKFAVPELLPTLRALWADLSSDVLISNTWITMQETFIGIGIAAVAGVLLGVAIGLVRVLDVMLYPLNVALQAIPKLALAPLFIIIFGFGMGSKIAVGAMMAFFPILVGVIQGMRTVRLDEIDLLLSLRASRWQTFWKLRVPRAMPAAFGGFEIAAIFTLTATVVTEFLGGTGGLGYLILVRTSWLQVPETFSVLIALGVIGVSMSLLLHFLQSRLSNWTEL